MPQENVTVDLKSTADVSGFQKFESSYNSLRAAKTAHIAGNDLLVQSERRVRTNLTDLVTGLGSARDGMDATANVVQHLSEVFKIGFAGTVIAGIGAAIVEQFSKADEAIAKTRAEVEKTGHDLRELDDEIEGRTRSKIEREEEEFKKQTESVRKQSDEISNPGFFKTAAIGLSVITGGEGALRDYQAAAAANLRNQAELQKVGGELAVKKVNDEFSRIDDTSGFTFSKEKPKEADNVDLAALAAIEDAKSEQDKRTKEEAARTAAAAARTKEEAEKSAAREKARAAEAAARQEAKEEKASDRTQHIKAHIVAGGDRQLGGGGGVYSVITQDPVVEEARKHTTLLTEISNTLKATSAGGNPVTAPLT